MCKYRSLAHAFFVLNIALTAKKSCFLSVSTPTYPYPKPVSYATIPGKSSHKVGAPTAQKKATENAVQDTFEAVFNEWRLIRVESLSESTTVNIKGRISTHALPYIGAMPVTQITSKIILEVARRIAGRCQWPLILAQFWPIKLTHPNLLIVHFLAHLARLITAPLLLMTGLK